ncbi:Ig-like domain-containing protein [Curtobacterium sp. MCBD17_040]|uniref:Ig-like domain-containing protein n=1 Tax=Curtobacterium sp. MCBD17_040 TaxID=2175674 RepID=UPI0011B6585B|nr:Ig-like domain-containing protein [Curtobacterium sp. MCBD17_040]WIB65324.1 Ig-like domain-containing protein [Curtobacterium sp. MCBD17_040]
MKATICPVGDRSSCVTATVTITAAAPYAPNTVDEHTLITDTAGTATFAPTLAPGSGPANPKSVTVTSRATHGTVTALPDGSFRYTASAATDSGTDHFTYRACAAALAADCRSSTELLTINDGFGLHPEHITVTAGSTTTIDLNRLAIDPTAWQLDESTVTASVTAGTVNASASNGQVRITAPLEHPEPAAVTLCAAGRNHVRYCAPIAVTVLPAVTLPAPPPVPTLLRTGTNITPISDVVTSGRPAAHPTATASKPAGSGGLDVTWLVIGGACLFAVGGGMTTFRGRNGR